MSSPIKRAESSKTNRAPKGGFSIQTKVALAFLALLALVVVLGLFSLRQIESVGAATRAIQNVALPKVLTVSGMQSALNTHTILAKRRVQTTDFRQLATVIRSIRAAENDFMEGLDYFQNNLATAEEISLVDRLQWRWTAYLASYGEVSDLIESGTQLQAQQMFDTETNAAANALDDILGRLTETARDATHSMSAQVQETYRRARILTLGAAITGILASLLAIHWIASRISQPLLKISAAMRRLTEGRDETLIPDLTHRNDEIGILTRAATAFRGSVIEARQLALDVDRERERLQSTVRDMPVGLCMFDTLGQVVVTNLLFIEIYDLPEALSRPGSPQEDILRYIGQRCFDANVDRFVAEILDAIDRGGPETAVWRLEGDRSISTILQTTPDGWMLIGQDVTDRVQAESRIRHLACTDTLTGLANRAAFQEAIETALDSATEAEPVAVMFIDLDRFKNINDTLGHPVGDALLRHVGARLNWVIGENDIVARLGGDEFAVIQNAPGQPEAALALGRRIIDQLASPFNIDGVRVQIGGSVGIAFAPQHGISAEDVQRHADLALYAVKEQGKGHCQIFDDSMSERQLALHELEQALREALKSNDFVMHYQPLFDLKSGTVWGAEALIRWEHPTRGAIPPSEFMSLAEELGLIQQISAQILTMSCRAASAWPKEFRVSINLAPLHFHSHDVLSDVRAAVDASGIDPSRVEIEVTEGVILNHTDETIAALHRLRDMGMGVSLDDFGTGYSSLLYLRAFPFDRVKIDSSFVSSLPEDKDAETIVQAICGLSAALGIEVTAEGIETEAQLRLITDAGCSIGQGYLFAHPMPEDEFRRFLADLKRPNPPAKIA